MGTSHFFGRIYNDDIYNLLVRLLVPLANKFNLWPRDLQLLAVCTVSYSKTPLVHTQRCLNVPFVSATDVFMQVDGWLYVMNV